MKQKALALFSSLLALMTLVSCQGQTSVISSLLSGNSGSINYEGKSTDFSFWIGTQGINGGLYTSYQDNPAVKWLTGENKFGLKKDRKVSLTFDVPPSGAEADNFNTCITTGDYRDVMMTSYTTTPIKQYYEDGIAMDLTPYVDQFMPNYKKWYEEHPNYKKTMTTKIDGKAHYLLLANINKSISYWGGFMYRRDWIAKYGTNPKTNAAFHGSWNSDKTKWSDDIIFPNGTSDPLYITDWEWMFKIFKKAMADQNVSDGYCLSIPYPGYYETGDLASSFGGEGPYFSTLKDGSVDFGGTKDTFRTYLKAMNAWYKDGYLDKRFAERTNDAFYMIDSADVYTGKVGLFYSYLGLLGHNIEDENMPLTKDICIYPAPHPINNIYGDDKAQNIAPQSFYQSDYVSTETAYMVTSSAKDKDLEALFTMLDYMYSDEGMMLTVGLNKKQYEAEKSDVYQKEGWTDGAYTYVDKDGKEVENGSLTQEGTYWKKNPYLINSPNGEAASAARMPAMMVNSYKEYAGDFDQFQLLASEVFSRYTPNYGLLKNITSYLSSEDAASYSKTLSSVRTFMAKQCPKFISGSLDLNSDDSWNGFVSALKKYKVQEALDYVNKAIQENS
ncbi:MAG: hypothetical protein LKJ88_04965 [Bacilli bacterium]|jgi:putative aldouronate transport system substrate-binding protein|nr:hypothetical protein [Bacilli bacterium]